VIRATGLLRWRAGLAVAVAAVAVLLAARYEPASPSLPAPAPIAPDFEPPLPPAEEPAGNTTDWQVELRGRGLAFPVQGIPTDVVADTFDDPRGRRRHEAIDIMAPRHTPVVAVEAGHVARLFESAAGGVTVYQFDPTQRYCYYYAHLERYARGLREGDTVERGQLLGYVGSTGNAPDSAPHLHFAIYRLGEGRRWWEGEALNPYWIWRD
jgi:murein DD-endopeptidase MepM/ murein hydrolase activator NlpD